MLWGVGGHQRKANFEDGAFDRSALHRQFGTMRIGDPSRNREAEAAAGLGLSLAQVCLIKAVEDMFAHIAGYSDGGIAQSDHGFMAYGHHFGVNFAVFG